VCHIGTDEEGCRSDSFQHITLKFTANDRTKPRKSPGGITGVPDEVSSRTCIKVSVGSGSDESIYLNFTNRNYT
jgi:hypothetical protein